MKLKLDKKFISLITVYGIALVLYMVAFLIIPFPKIAASWISFVFTIIAVIVSTAVTLYAFGRGETLVSKVYGFPIFRVGAVYLVAQFGVGVLICIFASFLPVPYWIALLTSLLLLGVVAIGVIVTDNTKDLVEEAEEQVKVDTKQVTFFHLNVTGIVQQCDKPEVKKELERLQEQFRFSDPVSNEETKEIEEKLAGMLEELQKIIEKETVEEIRAYIKKVSNTLAERNQICKATKK